MARRQHAARAAARTLVGGGGRPVDGGPLGPHISRSDLLAENAVQPQHDAAKEGREAHSSSGNASRGHGRSAASTWRRHRALRAGCGQKRRPCGARGSAHPQMRMTCASGRCPSSTEGASEHALDAFRRGTAAGRDAWGRRRGDVRSSLRFKFLRVPTDRSSAVGTVFAHLVMLHRGGAKKWGGRWRQMADPPTTSCAGASPRARAARITFVQSTVGPTGHFLARSRSRARPAFVSAEVGWFGVCFSVICALHCAGHLVCLARRCLCPARAVLCEPPPVRWPTLSVRWTWGSAASRPLGARRCASSCRHRARLRPHFPPASAREVVPPRGPRLRRTRKWGSHSVGCFRFVFRLFVFFAVVVARVAD